MVFTNPATVKITAETGTSTITFDGITSNSELTPENAAEQINKFLDLVNKSVSAYGMKRTVVMEAVDNG